jgi:predicted RNase H-like HicB family nuclease
VNDVKYTVLIEHGRELGYVAQVPVLRGCVAQVPVLRGCVSQGTTKEEALANVKEAMEAYIGTLLEDGIPIPTEAGRETVEIEVTVR